MHIPENRLITTIIMAACAMSSSYLADAQQLFTAKESPTRLQLLSPRNLNYWPLADGSIVTVDGHNRFTRALYGNNKAGRLETSDMLEFGLYMPYMGGNVLFTLPSDNVHVTSRFTGDARLYDVILPDTLREEYGRPAVVHVEVRALSRIDSIGAWERGAVPEGGIWSVTSSNVRRGTSLHVRYGAASNASFSRNGDLGVDRADCFDFTLDRCRGNRYTLRGQHFTLHYGEGSKKGARDLEGLFSSGIRVRLISHATSAGNADYLDAEIPLGTSSSSSDSDSLTDSICHRFVIASRLPGGTDILMADSLLSSIERQQQHSLAPERCIRVVTPDPVINALGRMINYAADAIWDDDEGVWMHGAIGWRMPLPGWRAAYTGDVMGWHDRARRHFEGYAASQLTGIAIDPSIAVLDSSKHLARATEKLGTPMYSTGYICRLPNSTSRINHYDMNLVYVDELLWHFAWTGDWAFVRRMWPLLKRHLEWEKRNFDPDQDSLYDAYCCIWASDGLYYSGGAVTHSSAYNYRAFKLASVIAQGLSEGLGLGEGEELSSTEVEKYRRFSQRFQQEADAILTGLNRRLWTGRVWAEYQDAMGLRRLHKSPALWTVYHAIDSETATLQQARSATRYLDEEIPRYDIMVRGDSINGRPVHFFPDEARHMITDIQTGDYYSISTTNWQPYGWSINNVALAEEMHTSLAYWQALRPDAAFHLFRGALIDGMLLGASPGNIGQISYYDAARGECYRDFGDPVGITARTLVQGLFGVIPDRLHHRIYVRPGFPSSWSGKPVSLTTPDYEVGRRVGAKGKVEWYFKALNPAFEADTVIWLHPEVSTTVGNANREAERAKALPLLTEMDDDRQQTLPEYVAGVARANVPILVGNMERWKAVDLTAYHNLDVTRLFEQKYLSPRWPHTTLSIPVQGIGEWCHPDQTFKIDDGGRGLRAAFTSRFDNFPTSVTIPLELHRARSLRLTLVGTTNPMQCRIANGIIRVGYADGTADSLELVNPINWWPLQEDLMQGLPAFYLGQAERAASYSVQAQYDVHPPLRMRLRDGHVYEPSASRLNQPVEGGAANVLVLPVDASKDIAWLQLECLSNDVIIGLMGLEYSKKGY